MQIEAGRKFGCLIGAGDITARAARQDEQKPVEGHLLRFLVEAPRTNLPVA
jgi:hypothetical protein